MNAKEYLSQVMHIDQRINSKLEQVVKLRESATKATATLSDMPRSDSQSMQTILRNTEQVCKQSSGAFAFSKIEKGGGYIYVPSALVDAYKVETNWSTYASQIRAIEDYPDICGQ